MESTKSSTVAVVAALVWMVQPATAQDRPQANTAVELTEHVQEPRQIHEQNLEETSGDQWGGDGTQPTQNIAVVVAKEGAVDEWSHVPIANEGEDVAVGSQEIATDEGAYIPRGRTSETAGDLALTAQTEVPWYRSPLIALVVVLALIGAVAAAFRRWVPAARAVTTDQLRVVGRTAISSKQSVVLLHVGKRIVLLGATGDSVNVLSEITDEAEVAVLLGRGQSVAAETNGFDTALAREFEQYEAPALVTQEVTPSDPSESAVDHSSIVEPRPTPKHQTSEKKRTQLHDLLARLRTLQKS